MSDNLLDWVRMAKSVTPTEVATELASVQPIVADTLEQFIHKLQIDGLQKQISAEYPGIFEAKDSFESANLRNTLDLIMEGDFKEVNTGVNAFNTMMNDQLMNEFGLEKLSEQDKFTLAMLRGNV